MRYFNGINKIWNWVSKSINEKLIRDKIMYSANRVPQFSVPSSIHVILYTVLSQRSLARIITMSKCPAQGMTMFPRRCNILLAVSKSRDFQAFFTRAATLSHLRPKICDDKVQSAIVLTHPQKREKGNAGVYAIAGTQETRLLKFMQICHAWIILRRETIFLNGLICFSLSNGEDGNKIHGSLKCAQNIFLSISEHFLISLTLVNPFGPPKI